MATLRDMSIQENSVDLSAIANNFWITLMPYKNEIDKKLRERNHDSYRQINNIVDRVKIILGINDQIGMYFGIDVRNGVELAERKNHIELIISPLLQRKNKKILNELYNTYFKYIKNHAVDTPWSVIKYKFWQPSHLQTISINYNDSSENENDSPEKDTKLIEITQSDFSYFPILDSSKKENCKLDIILFINDDVSKYLIKKETMEINKTERDIWIPFNNNIYTILDSAIGEFNLLNTLDKMEIYLMSEHNNIKRHPLKHLTQTINMINNNPLSLIHVCSRCEYSSTQTSLKLCICKKIYYCDTICQRANRSIHKLTCVGKIE